MKGFKIMQNKKYCLKGCQISYLQYYFNEKSKLSQLRLYVYAEEQL